MKPYKANKEAVPLVRPLSLTALDWGMDFAKAGSAVYSALEVRALLHFRDQMDKSIHDAFYLQYLPSPTARSPSHAADAMSLLSQYQYRDKLDRDRGPISDSALDRYRRYLDPNNLPHINRGCDPHFGNEFMWGPQGEWIGVQKSEEFERSQRGHSPGSPMAWFQYTEAEYHCSYGGVEIVVEPFHSYTRDCFFVRFANYGALSRGLPMTAQPLTLLLAAWIQNRQVNPDRLVEWTAALRSKLYKFGFGMLRDHRDHYDAFGVLAELRELPWTQKNGEWQIEGDQEFISIPTISSLLGLKGIQGEFIEEFRRLVNQIIDSSRDFEYLIGVFNAAPRIVEERIKQLTYQLERRPVQRYYPDDDRLIGVDYTRSAISTVLIDHKISPSLKSLGVFSV